MLKPSNVKYRLSEMQKRRSAELHEIILDIAQCCRVCLPSVTSPVFLFSYVSQTRSLRWFQ
jgi:hypothetical protein